MDFDRYKYVRFERRGRVIVAALSRPDHLNAVSGEMHRELAPLFTDLAHDPDSDVIVLTGDGGAFSAGGDFDLLLEQNANPFMLQAAVAESKQLVFGMLECSKPIIGRINGDAIGLGCTVALLCDIIVATETARFGDPHVKVGLTAGDGGAVIWPQLVGFARAKQYLLSGDLLDAREAEQIGLINFAVPAEELDEVAFRWADRIARAPQLAVRSTKTVINMELKRIAHAEMDAGMAYEAMTMGSEDLREAIDAIKSRRKPTFVGR
ncbi:enoyl-CoA hydratase-related protein [Novosphingobium pokkalii]|uniref:Enoyl-CoA hydratase-related protein n=1 Tax=Novosphingobium pokkalii TaxID=1770194 RepID=A0ABV7VC51_9SPHN|nr:enoyl-CoA hydratase-related protein [Novosphingobium pokkalii]GHD01112.1 enoyl-CoA hydratase [Novosphingobium pokkalii]